MIIKIIVNQQNLVSSIKKQEAFNCIVVHQHKGNMIIHSGDETRQTTKQTFIARSEFKRLVNRVQAVTKEKQPLKMLSAADSETSGNNES